MKIMNTPDNIEDRLWDYIDGSCTAEERSFIEKLIDSNTLWKNKHKELIEVHQLMQNSLDLDEPSMRFRQNVMEEIARYHIAPATKSYINKRVIWGLGTFFIVMILGFVVYAIGQVNWADNTGNPLPIDLGKIEWSKLYNNTYTNVFVMINVVLGLMLLDMYLGKKKNKDLDLKGVLKK
jgi:hypothetical protein